MTAWTERFRELESDWTRAPSAHNTQPWTVSCAPDEVALGWDPRRELPAGDPTGRDLFLSLGAFLETCLIVAADAGLAVRCEVAVAGHRFARLLPAAGPYATPFTRATVRSRACARSTLEAPSGARGTTGRGLPEWWAGPVVPRALAGLVELPVAEVRAPAVIADRWLFSTGPVVRELRSWLRLSPRHPRYRADGLTDRCLGLSRIEALALRAVLALRLNRPLAPVLAASGGGVLEREHPVLVLTGAADTPEALIEAGRELVRIWYALTEQGLAVHPYSQLIDCPETAAQLHARLGARPLAVFRVGRPLTPPPRSARRKVQQGAPAGL